MRARLRVSDLVRLALAWGISSLALITADRLLSGLRASSPWDLVAAAAVTSVFGFAVRPLLIKGGLRHPTQLLDPAQPRIQGAEELHRALVSMLVRLGHRSRLATTEHPLSEKDGNP
jgi:hypothetical protein